MELWYRPDGIICPHVSTNLPGGENKSETQGEKHHIKTKTIHPALGCMPVMDFPGSPRLVHAYLGDDDVPSLYATLEILLATHPPRAEDAVHPVLHVARVGKNEARLRPPRYFAPWPAKARSKERMFMFFDTYSGCQRLKTFRRRTAGEVNLVSEILRSKSAVPSPPQGLIQLISRNVANTGGEFTMYYDNVSGLSAVVNLLGFSALPALGVVFDESVQRPRDSSRFVSIVQGVDPE